METKVSTFIKFIIVLFSGIFFCFGLYYLVDTIWNGSFIDWFSNNYMTTYDSNNYGKNVIVKEPLWYKIKILILYVFIINIVLWITSIFFISHFYAKKQVHKTISAISNKIHSFMTGTKEVTDIFPSEYAQISTQIVQIKSTMEHHEHVLKEEANRKNDLITYLAHDLKTPLTSIIGYLSLLDEISDMPAQQKAKYIRITLDKANRLEKLINEFFDITRYNLQQIILEKETIDLYYMLVQMIDEFYPILTAHGNCAKLYADESLTIYADPIKLARVFNNILKNAVAYSYPNTVIEVWAKTVKEEIQISFQNKGKTIPKQKLTSIFEKFFRLDEARTTNTGGAGLGLAIAKEIIILHGGTITADSENELTTFCVTLPLHN